MKKTAIDFFTSDTLAYELKISMNSEIKMQLLSLIFQYVDTCELEKAIEELEKVYWKGKDAIQMGLIKES